MSTSKFSLAMEQLGYSPTSGDALHFLKTNKIIAFDRNGKINRRRISRVEAIRAYSQKKGLPLGFDVFQYLEKKFRANTIDIDHVFLSGQPVLVFDLILPAAKTPQKEEILRQIHDHNSRITRNWLKIGNEKIRQRNLTILHTFQFVDASQKIHFVNFCQENGCWCRRDRHQGLTIISNAPAEKILSRGLASRYEFYAAVG